MPASKVSIELLDLSARQQSFIMDTDDLSKETYNAVLGTADKFHHDLTIQFGLLSYDCDHDDGFLNESEALIKSWLGRRNLQDIVADIFFDNLPGVSDFRSILKNILAKISKVREIPIEQRTFD